MSYNHLAEPDPELAPILAKVPPAPPTYTENLAEMRIGFNTAFIDIQRNAQRSHLPPESAYIVEEHQVTTVNPPVTIRAYRPSSSAGATFPLIFYTHGGGWVFGNLEMDDFTFKILTVELGLAIVSVDYRLAPETPFPGGLYDCFAALKWVAQNADIVKGDLSRGFLLGGQSAGANYAGVLAHLAKADPVFAATPLTGQVLSIPSLCHPDAYPDEYKADMTSFVQNVNAPILAPSHMRDYYEKLQAPPGNPEFSPLLYPSFSGLPPIYFQICGLDPLRDEGFAYNKKAIAAGVPTKVDVYPGVPHGFHLSFPETTLAKKYNEDFKNGILWLLSSRT
ncbi:Alpha/Beta hydrolase protein [Daedaleopsis nitida]|nr:Alpha/Beta hydrolase protein [Daedaleopsis nitida]